MSYVNVTHNDFIIVEKRKICYLYSLKRYELTSVFNNHGQGLHLDYNDSITLD